MAEIAVVSVSKGVTVSVGKFESIRIDAHVEVRGEKGEDPDDLFEIGWESLDEQINKQLEEIQDVVGEGSVFNLHSAGGSRKSKSRKRQ